MSGFMPLAPVDLIILVNLFKELLSGRKDYIFCQLLRKQAFNFSLTSKIDLVVKFSIAWKQEFRPLAFAFS
jgi:hypothetical protein